jgi:septal ring factor EnvC (AmiA/AmiB activator)
MSTTTKPDDRLLAPRARAADLRASIHAARAQAARLRAALDERERRLVLQEIEHARLETLIAAGARTVSRMADDLEATRAQLRTALDELRATRAPRPAPVETRLLHGIFFENLAIVAAVSRLCRRFETGAA